jgi:hypothetical protein
MKLNQIYNHNRLFYTVCVFHHTIHLFFWWSQFICLANMTVQPHVPHISPLVWYIKSNSGRTSQKCLFFIVNESIATILNLQAFDAIHDWQTIFSFWRIRLTGNLIPWLWASYVNLQLNNWWNLRWMVPSRQSLWEKDTVQHLFISCPLAKMVWHIVHIAININLFGDWLVGPLKKDKVQIWVGACALL